MGKQAAQSQVTGYTIDELAAESGVPSRTIRFYQSKGALQKPEIHGRVAYYNKDHLERLELIAQLQDRGLSIRAIRDLMQRIDAGEVSLSDWLGLEAQLQTPWIEDAPALLSESELMEILGKHQRPGLVAELTQVGTVQRKGDRFLVPSRRLLQHALQLLESGIPLSTSVKASEIIFKHTESMAEDLVQFYISRLGKDFAAGASSEEIVQALQALRPVGIEAVGVLFGQSIERMFKKLVESGKLSELQARMGKRKKG